MQSTPTSDHAPTSPLDGAEAVELIVYLDASRAGTGAALYEELETAYLDHGLRISHRLTAAESFGQSRHAHHDTSTDLDPPIAVVAVDSWPVINSTLGAVSSVVSDTLVTLAPTAIVTDAARSLETLGPQPAQLTIHCRRGPGHHDPRGVMGVVATLRRHGIAGATALGRGEGIIAGSRHSRHLFSPTADGPMMVVSIDCADVLARAAPALSALPQVELMTARPVELCRWRGHRTPAPAATADTPAWSRITLYTPGETLLAWHPAHHELIDRLRKARAPGATALRGVIGYALGDPLGPAEGWYRHRRTPVVTTLVDTPDRAEQWLTAIDEVIEDDNLVTHDFVSALRLQ